MKPKLKRGDKVIFLAPISRKEPPYPGRIYTIARTKTDESLKDGDYQIFVKEDKAQHGMFYSEKPIRASKLVRKIYGIKN